MRIRLIVMPILLVLIGAHVIASDASVPPLKIVTTRPNDFVNVKDVIPEIQTDIRYFSSHNFVGRRVNGYLAPVCLLTSKAATALKPVEQKLLAMKLTIKVYDCYRPQTAVNDFAAWAKVINDTKMKTEFYPTVDKADLFNDNYIAYQSGHTRGSTLDMTIVPVDSTIPAYNPKSKLITCTSAKDRRFADNSLDFGTGFDCFSPVSHPDYTQLSAQVLANRLLLRDLMITAGFKPLDSEWWHFTLVNEPYPDTYFDFMVK